VKILDDAGGINRDQPSGAHPFAAVFGAGLRADPIDRAGRVGRVCGIATLLLGSNHPLIAVLRAAERDDQALARALDLIDALPTLTRRKLIASYGATQWAQSRRAAPEPDEPEGKFSDLPALSEEEHQP
jgi:hypothetical protein